MKILQIVDTPNWAIDTLASTIIKYNPHINFRKLYIPPRGVKEHLEEFKENFGWADIIHYQYWRTCSQLLELVPEARKIPSIVTHHNQKNILSEDWDLLTMITCATTYSENKLVEKYGIDKVSRIPYGIDLNRFSWNENYPQKEVKIGYVGRIVPWKRVKQIMLVCKELGYKMIVMGKPDKADYWQEILKEVGEGWIAENVDFHLDIPNEDVRDVYAEMTVFVGNSWEGRESGTLPFLEAMAVGVPILTTPNGLAQDIIEDGKNAILLGFNNPVADTNWGDENRLEIRAKLKMMVEDEGLRKELRENAWQTVKNMSEERFANGYAKLYNKILFKGYSPIVSVIVPTYNRKEQVLEILSKAKDQVYSSIEWIVCDDNSDDETYEAVIKFRYENPEIVVKYVNTKSDGYNLAKARNLGVIESEGEILIFLDSRFCPEPEAVALFVEKLYENKDNIWYWGDKGFGQRNFVENFSAVRREKFIKAGMFNERIDKYGGMSQEIRTRFGSQGFEFKYVEGAKANQIKKSPSKGKNRKQEIWEMKLKLYKMYGQRN